VEEARAAKKDKWVKDNLGQLLVAAARVAWAGECEKALVDPQGARGALGALCKRWDALLARLAGHARASLSDVERAKARRSPACSAALLGARRTAQPHPKLTPMQVAALLITETHARDVAERLHRAGARGASDFEWTRQLRFYWSREANDCVVKQARRSAARSTAAACSPELLAFLTRGAQALAHFAYGHEYQGNNGRLVVTPLTDRCYLAMGAALAACRVSNLLGPPGTGARALDT